MNIEYFNNSIVILNDSSKSDFLVNFSDKLVNVKIVTLSELKRKYYFDYDNKAIHYIIKKYGVVYDTAKIYLDNIYYVNEKSDNDKIDLIYKVKNDLIYNNLLIFNDLFKSFLRNKRIILYNLKYIDKFYNNIIDELKLYNDVVSYDKNVVFDKKCIYSSNSIEDEITFVAEKICSLILDGVDINKIKLYNVSSDYIYGIKKIFKLFNIPVNLPVNSVYGSIIVNKFKEIYSNDISDVILKLSEYVRTSNDKKIYKKIINLINSYAWCDNYDDVKDEIFNELKNISEVNDCLANAVNIISDINVKDNEYLFILNFNEKVIPVNYKDEDYFSDSEKTVLGISTSSMLNYNLSLELIDKIMGVNNLFISYSKMNNGSELYISPLYDEELFYIQNVIISNKYSNSYNKLKLVGEKDEFYKYGVVSNLLKSLYLKYDEEYLTYDNKFKGVNLELLSSKISNKLNLSYSSMNTYYLCGFRYYLDNILKLNKFVDSFDTVIGNVFHEILSKCFISDEYDVLYNYDLLIKNSPYTFNNSEKFFLDKLRTDLILIIDTIKEQLNYTLLDKAMYEKQIEIKINDELNIKFKGFVDKILYTNVDNKTIVAIIDYKTGNPLMNLNYAAYGLHLQLPVYVYLIKNSGLFDNVKIGGFYLQKIVNSDTNIEDKINSLKLQGFSNSDTDVLSYVDKSYDNSKFIKSLRTNSNGFYAYSKVLSDENIDRLSDLVEKNIVDACNNIINGKFDINPKQIGNNFVGCQFCTYRDICYLKNDDIVKLEEPKNIFGGEE